MFYTRLFSILFFHVDSFALINLAMLGLSAAGLWVFFRPSLLAAERGVRAVSALLPLLAVSLFLSYFGILYFCEHGGGWDRTLVLGCAVIPFLIGGLIVACILSSRAEAISSLYFFDMAGASLGALGGLQLIQLMNGPAVIVILAEAVLLAGLWLAQKDTKSMPFRASVALVPILSLFFLSPILHEAMEITFAKGVPQHPPAFERWSPSARVTVVGEGANYFQLDGSAISPIINPGHNFKNSETLRRSVLEVAYTLGPFEKVAIVGPGGGADVLAAITAGSSEIVGVEINRGIVDLMLKELGMLSGGVYRLRPVKIAVDEGRAFLAGQSGQFDLIQLAFTDTSTSSPAGAHTLSESYLYTTDALSDFLQRLKPNGIISFSRWGGEHQGFTETERVVANAERALRLEGFENPSGHFVVIRGPLEDIKGSGVQGYQADPGGTSQMATVLISKSPFSEQQLATLRQTIEKEGFRPLWVPGSGDHRKSLVDLFAAKGSDSFYREFYETHGLDISPVSDDKPFFFAMTNPLDFRRFSGGIEWRGKLEYELRYTPMVRLWETLWDTLAFLVVLVLLPLLFRVKARLPLGRSAPFMLYFSCLGLAFMGVELGLMQKFSLFLGHPLYSLSVTLAALLFSSAVGSLCTSLVKARPSSVAALIAAILAVMLVFFGLFAPALLRSLLTLSFNEKVAVTAAVVFPLGAMMGALYPLGVKALGASRQLVPWAWGLSTGFSVLAGVGFLMLSMTSGLTVTWIFFSSFYALAALGAFIMSRQADGR